MKGSQHHVIADGKEWELVRRGGTKSEAVKSEALDDLDPTAPTVSVRCANISEFLTYDW